MKSNREVYVFDWETYPNFACVSFISHDKDLVKTFVIDENINDKKKIEQFVKDKILVGYNSKTFDNILTNHVIKKKKISCEDLYDITQKIIGGQKGDDLYLYNEFKDYIEPTTYGSIDLMRLLFSKKLRVGLKELECSLHHDNVEELPYPFDSNLTEYQKSRVISYNINDCRATKKVLTRSIEAIQLRKWMKKEYGIDGYSTDGVNAGVKIIEILYEKEIGNNNFKKENTNRDYVAIKDCIIPIIKFETKEFQDVLDAYKKHIWYNKDYDEDLGEDSKLKLEPVINGFKFKFSLGGLHGETKPGIWESNDEYEVISIDVESYYPSMILSWLFIPEHLSKKVFHKVYAGIKVERLEAKSKGDDLKNNTLKLSLNGLYGMLGNKYSWLFDHKARLQICVNGQLMLAMLIEKLFKEGVQLIDANTDGIYVYLHRSKREIFNKIIKEWEEVTRMKMEETVFIKMWFQNTSDYFGTYLKKGKVDLKEKGMFLSKTQLGKGMEFPIIATAVKNYFLQGISYSDTILKHDNILDFISYKKLNKKFECYHNNEKVQRINRFYACKSGAYLFKKGYNDAGVAQVSNILKDSPVTILNKLDELDMKDRNINYSFYMKKAREIIWDIEKDLKEQSLF